jgi:hypothetical protein
MVATIGRAPVMYIEVCGVLFDVQRVLENGRRQPTARLINARSARAAIALR